MTNYMSNIQDMQSQGSLCVAYLKIERLSHDGLIEGYVCEEARVVDGSVLDGQPLCESFSVQDVELGLSGWASEYLVKRVHITPKAAFGRLFKKSTKKEHVGDVVDVSRDGVWFKLTRYDVSAGYQLVPLFTHRQYRLYVPENKAWYSPDGEDSNRKPVEANVQVVNPMVDGGVQRESDRVVALYDLESRMVIDFGRRRN